jgi:hypothetical protein
VSSLIDLHEPVMLWKESLLECRFFRPVLSNCRIRTGFLCHAHEQFHSLFVTTLTRWCSCSN